MAATPDRAGRSGSRWRSAKVSLPIRMAREHDNHWPSSNCVLVQGGDGYQAFDPVLGVIDVKNQPLGPCGILGEHLARERGQSVCLPVPVGNCALSPSAAMAATRVLPAPCWPTRNTTTGVARGPSPARRSGTIR